MVRTFDSLASLSVALRLMQRDINNKYIIKSVRRQCRTWRMEFEKL